jgi:hypothetical protein
MRAAPLSESNIPESVSSRGKTKQADSWPPAFPAFMRVGEFGKNRRLLMISKNRSAQIERTDRSSTAATATDTR